MWSALSPYWPNLLLVYSAALISMAAPGPSTLAIMGTSMAHGRLSGLTLAAGVTAGSFTWGLLASIGVSTFIAAHAGALFFIKIAGGLYLLYLAWRSARSAMRSDADLPTLGLSSVLSLQKTALRGYLMHLTNPKAVLAWTAIIALGLPANAPTSVLVAILVGCFVISTTVNLGYALLFSTAPMINGYRRTRRWAEGFLAAFFAFAGFKLLTSKL